MGKIFKGEWNQPLKVLLFYYGCFTDSPSLTTSKSGWDGFSLVKRATPTKKTPTKHTCKKIYIKKPTPPNLFKRWSQYGYWCPTSPVSPFLLW